jgi:YgiT-type zinc finger domain-containing protein
MGRCPVCEKGELKEIVKDLVFTYKGWHKRFENEQIYKCDVCDEEILRSTSNKRIERELTAHRKEIETTLRVIAKQEKGKEV